MKRNIVRKMALLLALVMMFTIPLSACNSGANSDAGNGETMSETAMPDTFVIGMRGEAGNLDPHDHGDNVAGITIKHIFETLVTRNNTTMEYEPLLAESWEQIDDTTVRFYLKQGVLFQNGEEMTADDVVFSLLRGSESTDLSFLYNIMDMSKLKAVDTYTVDIGTYENFWPLFDCLSHPGTSIMSQTALEAAGSAEAFGRAPKDAGTGPYVFEEWIAGDSIVLVRNENYHQEPARYQKLIIRNITDDTTRALSLESGDIDLCIDVAPAQVDRISESTIADIITAPGLNTNYIAFNTLKEPFNDTRVRQALRYAMNLEEIVEVAYGNNAIPADGVYPNHIPVYAECPEEYQYPYDVEKAKELLAEAGYPDGFSMSLWTNDNQTRIDLCEMLKNSWTAIGVDVSIEILEFGIELEKLSNGEHDAFIMGWSMTGTDGDFLWSPFNPDEGYAVNRTQYKDPEFVDVMTQARQSLDQEERLELYEQAQNILRRDLPWIPVSWDIKVYGLRSTLTNLDPAPDGMTRIYTIEPKSEVNETVSE